MKSQYEISKNGSNMMSDKGRYVPFSPVSVPRFNLKRSVLMNLRNAGKEEQ